MASAVGSDVKHSSTCQDKQSDMYRLGRPASKLVCC
jgi:hypothetical protein